MDQSHKFLRQIVWQYFCYFTKPYLWYAGAASLLLITNALIILGLGYALRHLIDCGLTPQNFELLNFGYILSLLIAVVFAAAAFARILLTGWLGERIIADIKIKLFKHILTFDRKSCDQLKITEIVEHFYTNVGHIQLCMTHSLATLLRSTVQIVGATIMLWFTSPKLTILTLLIVPIIIFPIRMMGKFIRGRSDQVQSSQAAVNSFVSACLEGLVDIQLFQNESHVVHNFKKMVGSFLQVANKRLILRSLLVAVVIFMLFAAIITVIWIGSHDVIAAKLSAGSLTSFVFYAVVVGGSVNQMAELLGQGQNALTAFKAIVSVLQFNCHQLHQHDCQDRCLFKTAMIRFENVSFSYASNLQHRALRDVSFTIPHGRQIAIVGPSGAGKSTLFQLLTRLYSPSEGCILINDQSILDMNLATVRGQFSTVSQNPFLFDTTVYDSIAFGDTTASPQRVMQAAEQAGITEFIHQLPEGFDTVLGEHGLRLSNGQKQRLAIARALLRPAPILLMDEATNALDAINENIIQNVLEKIKGHRTVLIIAHRLSTVTNADHIIVLDHGRVVEQGNHRQLVNQNGLYRTLAEKQFFSLS